MTALLAVMALGVLLLAAGMLAERRQQDRSMPNPRGRKNDHDGG